MDVYCEKILYDFWFAMRSSYKKIAQLVIQVLLLFSSTWLCESTFSVLSGIK